MHKSAVFSLLTLILPVFPSRTMINPRELTKLPKLVVFDLDQCLWHPEMYELSEIPSRKVYGPLGESGEGVVGVKSGRETIELFPDARLILQALFEGKYGDDVRIAAASSADTPQAVKIGRTAMTILEILPGVTMRDAFAKGWPQGFEGNMQIGRSPPLSSDKASTHFPILRQETGVDYNDMVFFDDCNWGDHCANVERRCRGVVAQRTPSGLTIDDWNRALVEYSKRYS